MMTGTAAVLAPVALPSPPPEYIAFAVRAAAEGIPIGAIARVLKIPYEKVLNYLQRAKKLGAIIELPKPDWPLNQNAADRVPTIVPRVIASAIMNRLAPEPPVPTGVSLLAATEQEFLCRNAFRLTILEAGFLVVLLRCLFAEKEKLHAVIETQRHTRSVRPDRQETTDPKMVDVMICKLRKKMTALDVGIIIKTSWGKGYYLERDTKNVIFQILETLHTSSPIPAEPAKAADAENPPVATASA